MEENKLRWKELLEFIRYNPLLEASPGPCAVECLQGWKFHNFSKQPLQILDYSHSGKVFPCTCFPSFICCLLSCPCAPFRGV